MITKNDILKMARSVYKRSQGRRDRRLIHPHREWGVVLIVMVVIGLGGLLYNGLLYTSYNTIERTIEKTPPKTVRYLENDINRALETYQARADMIDRQVLQTPVVVTAPATTSSSNTEPDKSVENAATTTATQSIPDDEAAVSFE